MPDSEDVEWSDAVEREFRRRYVEMRWRGASFIVFYRLFLCRLGGELRNIGNAFWGLCYMLISHVLCEVNKIYGSHVTVHAGEHVLHAPLEAKRDGAVGGHSGFETGSELLHLG